MTAADSNGAASPIVDNARQRVGDFLRAEMVGGSVLSFVSACFTIYARLLPVRGASSILTIALAAGFASASHFSRRYRGHFGHSPREERGFASSFRRGDSSEP